MNFLTLNNFNCGFPGSDICPVNSYVLYTSKLDPRCPDLWQRPRSISLHYTDETWYEPRKVGHNTIDGFMKDLAASAKLQCKEYTNHSIRSTCIRKLDDESFEARNITALTGHHSESTIKQYAVKCPEKKKKQMFEALNNSVIPEKKMKKESTATVSSPSELPHAELANSPPSFTINIPQAADTNEYDIANFDLFQMDDEDDQLFARILNVTENKIQNSVLPAPTPPPSRSTSMCTVTSNSILASNTKNYKYPK